MYVLLHAKLLLSLSRCLVPKEARSGDDGGLHEVCGELGHQLWRGRLVTLVVLPLLAAEADLSVEVVLVGALEQLRLLFLATRATVEVDAVAVKGEVAVLVAEYDVVELPTLAAGRRRRWLCRDSRS